jgi:hypothetical protein
MSIMYILPLVHLP